jgi:hypothetical protein
MSLTVRCREMLTGPRLPRTLGLATLLLLGASGGAMADDLFPYTPTV